MRVAIVNEKNKEKRKQLQGKNLVYQREPPEIQKKLDTSRAKEWKKWMDFKAGIPFEKIFW